jgi:ClpP class serine protease
MFNGIAVQIIGGIVGTGLSIYGLSYIPHWFKAWKKRQARKNNVLSIVHAQMSYSNIFNNDTSITIKTHTDFVREYEQLDKNLDIHLIMHTVGGALSSAEAICNCISNHKGKGKIICYIPYYAYSGGVMIGISCSKIVMTRNAIIGPCDAQKPVGSLNVHSIASIIDTVNYKKDQKEKLNEEWLACSYDAELCKDRQREYVDKLIKRNVFTQEIGDKIYHEFFSGKYNHDKIFSAQEAKELGLNIEIVDELPSQLKGIIADIK